GGGCEAFVQTGRAVIPVTAISIRRIPNDTAQTTVYRGHATAWPRTHHTTKLHPLCCRVREVLQHEPGKARPGGHPAERTAHAARTEAVAGKRQHLRFVRAVSLHRDAGNALGKRMLPPSAGCQ